MEPVFFVMAILGCGDDTAACAVTRIEPARYATVAQCRSEMTSVLARHTDLSFPVVSAACRPSGPMIVDAGKGATKG